MGVWLSFSRQPSAFSPFSLSSTLSLFSLSTCFSLLPFSLLFLIFKYLFVGAYACRGGSVGVPEQLAGAGSLLPPWGSGAGA